MLWFKLIILFSYSDLWLQFTCQRHVGLVIILWYFIFVTLKKEHLAPNLKISFCFCLLTSSLCSKSLGSLVAPSSFLLLAEECAIRCFSELVPFWNEAKPMVRTVYCFSGTAKASSSSGQNEHSLASLLQYLLLPKQKLGQEQDFLLILFL